MDKEMNYSIHFLVDSRWVSVLGGAGFSTLQEAEEDILKRSSIKDHDGRLFNDTVYSVFHEEREIHLGIYFDGQHIGQHPDELAKGEVILGHGGRINVQVEMPGWLDRRFTVSITEDSIHIGPPGISTVGFMMVNEREPLMRFFGREFNQGETPAVVRVDGNWEELIKEEQNLG